MTRCNYCNKTHENNNTGCRNSGYRNSGDNNSGNYNSGYRNSGNYNSGDNNSGYRNSGYRNSGDNNSGYRNSGYRNSGDSNSGNYNSGDNNSGDNNSGYNNSGDSNSGNRNSGYRNSGDSNSGNYNSGDNNSGDNNSGNYNNGFFNTGEPNKIMVFNEWVDMKPTEFLEKYNIYADIPLNRWINISEIENPTTEQTQMGGYLKTLEFKEACQIWWKENTERHKDFTELPHFSNSIFKEITGIDVDEEDEVEITIEGRTTKISRKSAEALKLI